MTPPKAYLFFGPQGSGKTTQAQTAADQLGLPFFDTGDQLRLIAAHPSDLGKQISEAMSQGRLLENTLLRQVLESFIAQHDISGGIVMDGFPRTVEQCHLLDELQQEHGWQIIGVYIDITDEESKERLAKRKIIVDGVEQSRPDDQPEIVAKRLANFKQQTLPAIEYIKNRYQLISIDGQPPIEEVAKTIAEALHNV